MKLKTAPGIDCNGCLGEENENHLGELCEPVFYEAIQQGLPRCGDMEAMGINIVYVVDWEDTLDIKHTEKLTVDA